MKTFLCIVAIVTGLVSLSSCRLRHSTDPDNKDTINYSVKLDGHTSYLQVADAPDLRLCPGNYTIETWVYYNVMRSDWQVIIGKDNMDSNTEFLLTFDRNTGKFRFQTRDFSTVLYSTTDVEARKWYHLAAVQNIASGTVKLYVNGKLEATANIQGRVVSTEYPIHIGTRINDITAGLPWYVIDGYLDDMRIWNVAKSSTEINATMSTQLKGNESGLVAYWDFNDALGIRAADKTGRGHVANFVNHPTWAQSTAPIH